MGTTTYCAIDFETANPARGSVCAIGLARFDAATGAMLAADGGLVTPPAGLDEFNPYNMRVHHISPRKIKAARSGRGAASWEEVLPWLVSFVADDVLVAHNAAFERSVITQATQAVGYPVPELTQRVVCTVKMAKQELPHLPKHRLPDVIDALGLPTMGDSHHDALADAIACGQIAAGLMQAKGASLEQLIRNSKQHQILDAARKSSQRTHQH